MLVFRLSNCYRESAEGYRLPVRSPLFVSGRCSQATSNVAASTEFGWPPNSLVRDFAPNTPRQPRFIHSFLIAFLIGLEIIKAFAQYGKAR
jgi:hypothetical protein